MRRPIGIYTEIDVFFLKVAKPNINVSLNEGMLGQASYKEKMGWTHRLY